MATTTASKTSTDKKRVNYYQKATERIIALLEKGVPPWRKTWGAYGLARNYATGHIYRGINRLMLNLVAPYDVPLYMSRKQLIEKGGRIKKGSKAEWVYFYGEYHKDADGNTVAATQVDTRIANGEDLQQIRFLKARPVYNVSCIEGIDITVPTMPVREHLPIERCEEFLNQLSPRPQYCETDTDCPCYKRNTDTIHIPHRTYFEASEEFYCTLFHEILHWTGHEKRLARIGITDDKAVFGSKLYSEEELIAEMGACFLCAHTGIDTTPVTENSAAYIQSWKTKLEDDSKLIFRAAAKAEQALHYLIPTP